MRKSQAGIGAAGFVLLLFVILIGGFTYYRVRQADKQIADSKKISNFDECVAAGNPVMESFPEQCTANGQTFTKEYPETEMSVLELQKDKYVEGWQVVQSLPSNVILDNKEVAAPTEGCTVNVYVGTVEDMQTLSANEVIDELRKSTLSSEKGYTIDRLGEATVAVNISSGTQDLTGYLDHWYMANNPETLETNFYQKTAYIVRSDYYIAIAEICASNDFMAADKALLAIRIN